MTEERKTTEQGPKTGARLEEIYYLCGLIAVILWIVSIWCGLVCLFGGVLLFTFGIVLSGYKFVPKPEKWVVEQFGQFKRNLEPGLNYVFPFLESIREKIPVTERSIPLFTSRPKIRAPDGELMPKIDFRDGEAGLVKPVVYWIPREDHPELTVYTVEDPEKWLTATIESAFGGFLNSLLIDDAVNEGMGRGNLVERLQEAPTFTRKKIKRLAARIKEIEGEMKDQQVMKQLLEIRKNEYEKEEAKLQTFLDNQKRLVTEYGETKKEAFQKGMIIKLVVISDYIFSDEVIEARQKPLLATLIHYTIIIHLVPEFLLKALSMDRKHQDQL